MLETEQPVSIQKKNLKNKKFSKAVSEKFEMLFLGDTSFGENYQNKLKENILETLGYDYSLEKMKPLLHRADFVVANLETPITDIEESPYDQIKKYVHWTHIEKAPVTLKEHNLSLVSLANNHAYDYGDQGLQQTLKILENHQIPAIGAGKNLNEALEPYKGEVAFGAKKFKFAIISAFEESDKYYKYDVYAHSQKSGMLPLNVDIISQAVQKIKKEDPDRFVILFPHWGTNYQWRSDNQAQLSERLIHCGVDLIIGHGAHKLQEFERREDKWIVYSLGNFVFNSPGRYKKNKAIPYSFIASLNVQLNNNHFEITLKLYPILSDNLISNYQSRFLSQQEFHYLNKVLKIDFLPRSRDEEGFFIELPINRKTSTISNNTKWIGMLCKPGSDNQVLNKMKRWMYAAHVIQHDLDKQGYKLFCYSPLDVDLISRKATGYYYENNEMHRISIPLPKITYDWYIGKEDPLYKTGLKYHQFKRWAQKRNYKIFASALLERLAKDKFQTIEILSKSEKFNVPDSQIFSGELEQLNDFSNKYNKIFIKPRYGKMGNDIFVIKNKSTIDYYNAKKVISKSVSNLTDCLDFINLHRKSKEFVIQQGIDCKQFEGSVFDIRVILAHDGKQWSLVKIIRLGAKNKEVSNIAQGGDHFTVEEDFEKIIYPFDAKTILVKIDETAVNIANYLKETYDPTMIEIVLDLLVDEAEKIFLVELNTKPGTPGRPRDLTQFLDMASEDKKMYENQSLQYGKYLAGALVNEASNAALNLPESKWIGFVWHHKDTLQMKRGVSAWMHRLFVIEQELTKYDYKLVCFSPLNVDYENNTVTGYRLENYWFKKVTVPLPKFNFCKGHHRLKSEKFNFDFFEKWLQKNNANLYPSMQIHDLLYDKLNVINLLSRYSGSIVPNTALFTEDENQIKQFFNTCQKIYIKPREGRQGQEIFVISKSKDKYKLNFYADNNRRSDTFDSIQDLIFKIKPYANKREYIIQEGIECLKYNNNVIMIRAIILKSTDGWNFISELTLAEKNKEISNIYQGGAYYVTSEILEKIFSKETAINLADKIKKFVTDVAQYLNEALNYPFHELSFDLLIDNTQNVFISEINVPPGLAGPKCHKYEINDIEKTVYANETLKHGEFLAQSLLSKMNPSPVAKKNCWFDDIKTGILINEKDCKVLFDLIFLSLSNKKTLDNLPQDLQSDNAPRILFLTVIDSQSNSQTFIGSGMGLLAAINHAVQQIDGDVKAIKLDIVQEVFAIRNHDVKQPLPYNPNFYGIAFNAKSKLAYLPHENKLATPQLHFYQFRTESFRPQQQKWIGLICHINRSPKVEGKIFPWMFRAFMMEQALAEYNCKIFCYMPEDIDEETKTARGYFIKDGLFEAKRIPVPEVNYDFFMGKSDLSNKNGLSYQNFEPWAQKQGYQIFPISALRKLTSDKYLTHKILSEYDSKIVPDTQIYTGELAQITAFFQKYVALFIKPQFGNKGNDIFVIKFKNNYYLIEYYSKGQKEEISFPELTEVLSFVQQRGQSNKYIIQQAIQVMQYQASIFDIRTILFKEGAIWHFLTELVIGKPGSAVSNMYQGGINHHTITYLSQIFPQEAAEELFNRIETKSREIAMLLDRRFKGQVNEVAFDFLIDQSCHVYVSEINVKPGLAGEPPEYINYSKLTDSERNLYETVTVKHGEYLAKSLISRFSAMNKRAYWFQDIKSTLALNEKTAKRLMDYIFDALVSSESEIKPPSSLKSDTDVRMVFLTVSNSIESAKTFLGKGKGLLQAVNAAITECKKLDKQNIEGVKLDLVQEVSSFPLYDISQPLKFERSLYGLAFSEQSGIAYLPEQLLSETLVSSKQYINPKRALKSLSKEKKMDVYQFTTQAFYKDSNATTPLYRGHKVFKDINQKEILDSALAAGAYLQKCVKPNGDFVYEYLPKKDEEATDYNVLRHAGTIYAMLELYELMPKADLLSDCQRALDNLVKRALPFEDVLCVVEKGNAKLGANALTLLALSKYMSLTNDLSYLEIAKKLATWMKTCQDLEGQFFIHKQAFSTQNISDFVSMYYPGEAIFSLVRFYEIDPNEAWLDMAQNAANWLINVRDKNKPIDRLEHDHWLLYGLNELYRYRPEAIYIEHAKKICQAILTKQYLKSEPLDYFGSYYSPPRSTPVATRAEGLIAAYHLFTYVDRKDIAGDLLETIKLCVRFQLQTQFGLERALYLPNPQRALGGFSASLTDYSIRIDYVQHNLSSLIGLYNMLFKAKVTTVRE